MYILNNSTLPTVCGLLRTKPTGRNVTVNVSFEAGDMAGWCSFIMFTLWDRFLHRLLSGLGEAIIVFGQTKLRIIKVSPL